MSKTEIVCLKVLVRDYIAVHGVPENVKKGLSSEAAKWFSDLIEKAANEKGMIK